MLFRSNLLCGLLQHAPSDPEQLRILESLISCGVPLDEVDDMGNDALMIAVRKRNFDAARCLLEHGAGITQVNNSGFNAFQIALHALENAISGVRENTTTANNTLIAAIQTIRVFLNAQPEHRLSKPFLVPSLGAANNALTQIGRAHV